MDLHDGAAAPENQPPPVDTGRLVLCAADGDDAAWRELVVRYTGVVAAVAAAHGLSDDGAAGVAAAVWRRLAGNLGRIRHPDRVGAWVGAVARDECVRALENAAHNGSVLESPE